MLATFDRRRVMKAAHGVAKWRVASVGGSYRGWFAKALAYEWKKAKAAIAREESNLGLPLRSCPADATGYRASATSETRVMRFGSARLFVGPGAREAAIEAYAARVGGRFQHARNQGRRAADWA